MSPLKNTDKYFSDFLPPALVKDWRQCFRSRSSVALFILLELAGWFLFACVAADADQTPSEYMRSLENLGKSLYGLGVMALCLIIPFRAGSTVAADTRVRSSNFLMLTPLSSRRIVWGTWSSTALIVLLAALLTIPLLIARRMMMGAYPHIWQFEFGNFNEQGVAVDCLILFWLVVVGWVMAGFYMFSSVLPRVLRVLLLLFCAVFALSELDSQSVQLLFGVGGEGPENYEQVWIPNFPALLLRVVDAALLLVLFLELTRRHYAAPAENCSRSVRLLAPLPFVIYGLMQAAKTFWGWELIRPDDQLVFAISFLFIALLSDALLPNYAMPAHAWKLWRGLPAWLQKPGFVPSTLCVALIPLFFFVPFVVNAWENNAWNMGELCTGIYFCMNLGFSLMLWLLITDCFCRRSATKRPLVFGVVTLACILGCTCLREAFADYPIWQAVLPFGGDFICDASSHGDLLTAALADGVPFFFLLLLLVFWRGRVKNA